VSIADRIARLDPREQRLLNGALLAVGVVVVLLLPISLTAIVHGKRSDNQALRDAADSITDSMEQIQRAQVEKAATLQRYATPAPPLAPFLAGLATEAGVEIPESQDRQAVPHGKKYTERSTKFSLHKVGMLKLLKFMERIEQSGNPITISSLNIRKRLEPPDQYDVEMMVSAFDRSTTPDKPKKATDAAASAAADEAKP
jgi:general secretion pathway protein M